MRARGRIVIGGVVAAAAVAVVAGVAVGSSRGEDDGPAITGDALTKASAAALASTGGGRVTGTETGDEESYYEVEVTLADGSQVDVQLDRQFTVVGSKADSDRSESQPAGS